MSTSFLHVFRLTDITLRNIKVEKGRRRHLICGNTPIPTEMNIIF